MASATAYDSIEDGIATTLEADGTPFTKIVTYGANLSEVQIANELERLKTHAPAAMVFYGGGPTNKGLAGQLVEQATFVVLVIAAGATAESAARGDDARQGVYQLLKYVREHLHNVPEISGITIPLLWAGNRRFQLPGQPLTVAAWRCEFEAEMVYADGPT